MYGEKVHSLFIWTTFLHHCPVYLWAAKTTQSLCRDISVCNLTHFFIFLMRFTWSLIEILVTTYNTTWHLNTEDHG
jgi:hypothetical protein